MATTPSPRTGETDVRLVVASSVFGTTVEWYDFFLYGTAAGLVFNKLYFPGSDPLVGTVLAFATFALGFLARPIGGFVFGHLGDRVGRKKILVATMLIMGVATCLIGLLPDYRMIGPAAPIILVVLRLAQGVAVGGEWGGAVLMATEYAPAGKRGLYGSFPQIGLAIGLTLGTGVLALLNAVTSDEAFLVWGWRIGFLLSAVLVVAGLLIRVKVMETPAFRTMAAEEGTATVPAVELVRDRLSRRHLLLGMGSRFTEGVAFNAWAVFVISYGSGTLKLDRQPLLIGVMIAAAVMVVFIPVFGRVSDRLGRRRTFTTGAVTTLLLAIPALAALHSGNPVLITLSLVAVLGISYPVMYGPQAAFYAELFPISRRCTGISVVYQLSGVVASGLTPLVLAYLAGRTGTTGILVYLAATTVVSVVCTLAIRQRDLFDDEVRASAPAKEAPRFT
ncbi:metabolite-proton symporter [Amycolatopsis echigonensis]|uniref:Putative proline/betaine transporter n=1 Tax=Amycolatopsis echigonensis TaxID=2576905 RepID=A0A2N3WR71_9PSEU|nr:MFS transporter [Amycolatopsis niigatensis]PKV96377.1 metabolite-proton symporter [Amycolatopsis niigatensis]